MSHDHNGKTLKKSPRSSKPISMKHSMQHVDLKYYNQLETHDHVMTLTYFMARISLVAHAFEWEKSFSFEGQILQEMGKWTEDLSF